MTDEGIDKMPLGRTEVIGMKAHATVMQALQIQIEDIEKVLLAHCRGIPGYRLFNTVPGIGETFATVILLQTGKIVARPCRRARAPKRTGLLQRSCTTSVAFSKKSPCKHAILKVLPMKVPDQLFTEQTGQFKISDHIIRCQ
ncbi:hypothetical protein [Collimonas arenae]|uniref:hypothetical protein n=1 Tax=Collimonas arenae TaxID=279058 RepID=UPI00077862CC|nr:hypothetical protein [Collimonas arenae]